MEQKYILLGKKFEEALEKKGYGTATRICEMLPASYQTVHDWKKGKAWRTFERMYRTLKYLGVDIDNFLSEKK